MCIGFLPEISLLQSMLVKLRSWPGAGGKNQLSPGKFVVRKLTALRVMFQSRQVFTMSLLVR